MGLQDFLNRDFSCLLDRPEVQLVDDDAAAVMNCLHQFEATSVLSCFLFFSILTSALPASQSRLMRFLEGSADRGLKP